MGEYLVHSINLPRTSVDLEGNRFLAQVHSLGPEGHGNLENLGPLFRRTGNLDEGKLPLDTFISSRIPGIYDVYKLVKLFENLFQGILVTPRNDVHVRKLRVVSL